MKVLYVVGACLTKNTSANMSHNAYVQGLLDNNCNVDVIMATDSWGEEDKGLPRWETVNYYEFESLSWSGKLKNKAKQKFSSNTLGNSEKLNEKVEICVRNKHFSIKQTVKGFLKQLFYLVFPEDPVYPLEKEWLKNASGFMGKKEYDLVISNSSPAASHKLVAILKRNKKIQYKRWIQIWEDPWYYDLYGGHSEKIKEEEHYLLREASEIYYVSPLTLEYQKKYYSDCSLKMKCIPLPFLMFGDESSVQADEFSVGYFGDYYSKTRNLKPFYDAVKECKIPCNIYGDSDINLISIDSITVSGRVTLDKLAVIQRKTGVLVHLCNLEGGQIPGKIYHYSATEKPILFILDGTEEEQKIIYEFFNQFHRYVFCKNNKESIKAALCKIQTEYEVYSGKKIVEFEPRNVVNRFL